MFPDSPFLQPLFYVPIWFMENESHETETELTPALRSVEGAATPPLPTATTRHDGWTGDKMAIFCETLAENVRASSAGGRAAQAHVVAEACDQAGMGFRALMRRAAQPVLRRRWGAPHARARRLATFGTFRDHPPLSEAVQTLADRCRPPKKAAQPSDFSELSGRDSSPPPPPRLSLGRYLRSRPARGGQAA